MYRADWTEKPNARAYRSLVLERWRTRWAATTDGEGTCAARGFQGDYVATVEFHGRRVEQAFALRPGAPAVVVVRLP
jgi:hypothetical protein